MDIKLNFINQSNALNNPSVVIFQKNVATNFDELAVAWKVIRNCGPGSNHPFTFPMANTIACAFGRDEYGAQLPARNGQRFDAVRSASGEQLIPSSVPATSSKQIELVNMLQKDALNAAMYKSSRLLAQKWSVVPKQKAVFEFRPTLWIGVASQVVEGEVMNSAILSEIDTEVWLLGIASADIVMTDGPGPRGGPFKFTLENIQMA
ncbi:MAG TPA: hypothetical protein VN029_09440 [Sphingomonas sp.]|nr:hypothetical protein [Sphingomonas sp.]